MKKILSYLLVIALVLVQFSPLAVSARELTETDDGVNSGSIQAGTKGSITITNTHEGKTYTIYQVLELESWDDEKGAYTYNAASQAWETFLLEGEGKNYLTYDKDKEVWTWNANADAQAFAKAALKYAEDKELTGQGTKTSDGTDVKFENLELGYYLIDSTAGALCMLTTTHKDIKINEKNELATVDKGVHEDTAAEGTYGDYNTADIGQDVEFQTKIDVKPGAENYELIDVMSPGLTLNRGSIKVAFSNSATPETTIASSNYTINYDKAVQFGEESKTATFTIEFNQGFLDTLTENDDIYVMYSATLNSSAVVEKTGNPNETWLEYGDNNETAKDTTITYTLSFDIIKKDQNQIDLDGAQFKLYLAGSQSALQFIADNGKYRLATPDEIKDANVTKTDIIDAGTVEIIGLDVDSYELEEVKAPDGYNKLTSRIDVILSMATENKTATSTVANNDDVTVVERTNIAYTTDDVIVTNYNGTLLPSTGGMGTVLFVTVGSIMVLGFGVLLVTKLRLSKMSI